jgi:predicted MFS family arabinose efflux permease
MRSVDAFAALREPQFAWYYAARVVSLAGTSMAPVALSFAVLDLTGSAGLLGLVLAARTVPMMVFLLVGGVLADRLPRAAVMRASNLLSALTQGLVAYLVVTGTAEIWMLVVLEAANGTVSAFSWPAMEGLVPQLAPRALLQQANALLSFSRAGLAVVGPTIAALLVVSVGSGWALAFDAFTWLAAAVLVARVRVPVREPVREPASDAGRDAGLLNELRGGWSEFTGRTWLWVVVAGFGVLNGIHAGAWFTLGPALAEDTFGAGGWGLVLSAESAGLLVTGLLMLKVRLTRPLLTGMLGMAMFALPLTMLGLTAAVAPLMLAAFLAGAGQEVFGIGWNVAVQENVDQSVLSRVYSYDALGSLVAVPLGAVVFGPLGEAFGYQQVLVLSGAAYLTVVLLVLSSRSVRSLRRVDVQPVLG